MEICRSKNFRVLYSSKTAEQFPKLNIYEKCCRRLQSIKDNQD